MLAKMKKAFIYIVPVVLLVPAVVRADDAPILAVFEWLAYGLRIVGAVLTLFGAMMFVMGFSNEDAEQKLKGLKFMICGGFVWSGEAIINLIYNLGFLGYD